MSDYHALLMQAQDQNRETIIASLRSLAVVQASVHYAGAGDSGDTCELSVQPESLLPKLADIRVRQVLVDSTFLGAGQRACSLREEEQPLDEAIRDFVMRWVYSLYPGWENNDGADGTVSISVHDNTIFLEHTSYYTESCCDEHTM